ncbi:methanogenesis marker protein Mmp4/MtxX [Methanomassiliicoccaceae archaeon COG_1]|nr:methanogenesis marker protein Mmp4/MtxX [Methanomassiliicoccaceae archaeon COG_1]
MLTSELLSGAYAGDVKVGIGCCPQSKHVEASVRAMDNPNIITYGSSEALARDLASGGIDAAVRGDLPSSHLLPLIREAFGLKVLERVVLIDVGGRVVFMAPVGIDEGYAVKDKVDMAERIVRLADGLGMEERRIAVMSGGRCEDRGRCPAVDRSIDSALDVVSRLKEKGYDAYHAQILIERAIDEADIILAPEGIAGNLIFRVLHFIGGYATLGAPVINSDRVFVDTSREKTDYTDALALALKLAGMRK